MSRSDQFDDANGEFVLDDNQFATGDQATRNQDVNRIVDLPVECHEAAGGQLLHRIAIERSRTQFDRDGCLDRGGIFLREDAELRGFWGMDEKGQPEQISQTIFPLYPERDEELTHTALIARGEKQYYLTQDLAAEGGDSIPLDYGGNVAVPMREGDGLLES